MRKKLTGLIAGLALVLSVTVCAQAATTYTEGALYYTISDNSITITGYFGREAVVDIPPMIAGYPVNTIAANAFVDTNATNVVLPDTITTVEENAFGNGVTIYFDKNTNDNTGNDTGDNNSGNNTGDNSGDNSNNNSGDNSGDNSNNNSGDNTGDDSNNEVIDNRTNDDGSTTIIVLDKKDNSITETTAYPDGSKTTVVTKSDGTVTTTKVDKDGNENTVDGRDTGDEYGVAEQSSSDFDETDVDLDQQLDESAVSETNTEQQHSYVGIVVVVIIVAAAAVVSAIFAKQRKRKNK